MLHVQFVTIYAIARNYGESVCDNLHTRVWLFPFLCV